MAVNGVGDTPFHSAARCQNPASMTAMLQTFPTFCFVGELSNDGFEKLVASELLMICARRGNSPAVGALIRLGIDTDIREVLREIVDESVRSLSDFERLLDVYHTIVEHAVMWHYGKTGLKMPKPDSAEYRKQRRRTVLDLLTKVTKPSTKSVIRHCIRKGANKFLVAILNTPEVFLSRDGFGCHNVKDDASQEAGQYVTYDVTDMTPLTLSSDTDEVGNTR